MLKFDLSKCCLTLDESSVMMNYYFEKSWDRVLFEIITAALFIM